MVKKWRILPRGFTIAASEMTPTLKVRNKKVNDQYDGLWRMMCAERS